MFCVPYLEFHSSKSRPETIKCYDLRKFALPLTNIGAWVTGKFVTIWRTRLTPPVICWMQTCVQNGCDWEAVLRGLISSSSPQYMVQQNKRTDNSNRATTKKIQRRWGNYNTHRYTVTELGTAGVADDHVDWSWKLLVVSLKGNGGLRAHFVLLHWTGPSPPMKRDSTVEKRHLARCTIVSGQEPKHNIIPGIDRNEILTMTIGHRSSIILQWVKGKQ